MVCNIIRILLVTLFSISSLTVYGQGFTVTSIPDSLKENANSVIRTHETNFNWQNATNGEAKYKLAVTILNKEGKENANFICYCDKFTELKKFSGEVFDGNGKVVRKIKKGDLSFTEYSAHLASDEKYYFYENNLMSYPYTILYEWEIKHTNGLIGFPVFIPLHTFNQSLEHASYQLSIPEEVRFEVKAYRMEEEPCKEAQQKKQGYTYNWQVVSRKAISKEPWAPSILSMVPSLYVRPEEFIFDGYKGRFQDWNSYGQFQYSLLQGRNKIPPALIQKIEELTAGLTDDYEKVKRLYDYLGENTRYVSIQLGIGGFQPMPAQEVYRTGFGDCKALTNYMMTMLQEIGIKSNYTVISTTRSRLIPDFPTANQMNHVILCVPLEKDTLWLECTNPQLPIGYIYNDIAGHDALLITEDGGFIKTLPVYEDSLHTEKQHITIQLSETGKATAKVNCTSTLFQYENTLFFTRIPPREQADYLRRNLNLSQAKIENVIYKEVKEKHPSLDIDYTVETNIFGKRTGQRLFVPVNAFRQGFNTPTAKSRQNDIVISFGYKDQDNISLILPDEYTLESLPKPLTINSEFGSFTSRYEIEENKILIYQELYMKSGRYPPTAYEEFINFRNEISKGYKGEIILRKKE